MVSLDALSVLALGGARFDHVGVDGALQQETRMTQRGGLGFKDADEMFTHDAAFLFRIANSLESIKEFNGSVHYHQFAFKSGAQGGGHLLTFLLAKQTGVHEDGNQLVADGAVDQGRSHTGIHPAADGSQDLFTAYLFAHA